MFPAPDTLTEGARRRQQWEDLRPQTKRKESQSAAAWLSPRAQGKRPCPGVGIQLWLAFEMLFEEIFLFSTQGRVSQDRKCPWNPQRGAEQERMFSPASWAHTQGSCLLPGRAEYSTHSPNKGPLPIWNAAFITYWIPLRYNYFSSIFSHYKMNTLSVTISR